MTSMSNKSSDQNLLPAATFYAGLIRDRFDGIYHQRIRLQQVGPLQRSAKQLPELPIMIKHILISFLAVCAISIAALGFQASAVAQPLAAHAARLEVLGEAGHWKGTGRYRDIRFTCEMVRTWSEDKGALFFTQRFFSASEPENKEPVSINSGMFGWDAAKKKIKTCWFITDGRSATDYLVAEKNRLVGRRYLSGVDGTETVHKVTLDLHPDGRIDYRSADEETGDTVIEIEWISVKATKE